MIVQYILGLRSLSEEELSCADVNWDGEVDIKDATTVMQYAVALIDQLPLAVDRVNEEFITVVSGTLLENIGLPSKVEAVLKDDSTVDLDVKWESQSTPEYNPYVNTSYAIEGELVNLPPHILNPNKIKALATVTIYTPYVWYPPASGPVFVESIEVVAEGDEPNIDTDCGTLQLYVVVKPDNADDKSVTWSVVQDTGYAEISTDGLLTAVSDGTVNAVATANDGSGVEGALEITITNQVDDTVNIAEIEGIMPPVTGGSAAYEIVENEQYSGSVSWEPDDDPFAAGQVYTATITLTAKPGYTFDGVPENFFLVAGADTVANEADSGIVEAVFPATLLILSGSPEFVEGVPPVYGTEIIVDKGTLSVDTNLTYTWYRSDDEAYNKGADAELGNGTSYIPVEEDIGNFLIVIVTTPDATGAIISVTDDKVGKAPNTETATVPTVDESSLPTATTITLTELPGHEYAIARIDDTAVVSIEWQSSRTFEELLPETGYSFIARIAETTTTLSSDPSVESEQIFTEPLPSALVSDLYREGAITYYDSQECLGVSTTLEGSIWSVELSLTKITDIFGDITGKTLKLMIDDEYIIGGSNIDPCYSFIIEYDHPEGAYAILPAIQQAMNTKVTINPETLAGATVVLLK
jgi:hypothetical protein